MRVPGKTGNVVGWPIASKVVEEQERIVVGRVAESEAAAKVNTRALERGLRL
jgi:hypothetical protein